MSNKNQTSLQFFLNGLIDLEIGKGISTDKEFELHQLYNRANALHKQQIIDAVDGFPLANKNLSGIDYYNEIYGGKNE